MLIFPPELFDAAWRIRDAKAAVMICMSWIPLSLLRELSRITDQISTFVFLGYRTWQFEGILPSSILCSKLVFDRSFSQNIFVAEAIGGDTSSQNRQGHQWSHWWCFVNISVLVLDSDQDDIPLPIQMILIDIHHHKPWKNLLTQGVCHHQRQKTHLTPGQRGHNDLNLITQHYCSVHYGLFSHSY